MNSLVVLVESGRSTCWIDLVRQARKSAAKRPEALPKQRVNSAVKFVMQLQLGDLGVVESPSRITYLGPWAMFADGIVKGDLFSSWR